LLAARRGWAQRRRAATKKEKASLTTKVPARLSRNQRKDNLYHEGREEHEVFKKKFLIGKMIRSFVAFVCFVVRRNLRRLRKL
jgi:hypothetical protein